MIVIKRKGSFKKELVQSKPYNVQGNVSVERMYIEDPCGYGGFSCLYSNIDGNNIFVFSDVFSELDEQDKLCAFNEVLDYYF